MAISFVWIDRSSSGQQEVAPDRVFGFDGLLPVAILHYLTGAVIVIFMITHDYLGTTGKTPTSMFKTMINGWHEE